MELLQKELVESTTDIPKTEALGHISRSAVKVEVPSESEGILGLRSKFAEETHHYISEMLRVADQKAGFIFLTGTALLTFLFKEQVSSHWLKSPWNWQAGDFLAFLSMLGLALSAMIAALVIMPRLKGSRDRFIYWERIAAFKSPAEFASAAFTLQPTEFVLCKYRSCYHLATICRYKYRVLNAAIFAGLGGAAATVIYLLFFAAEG